MPNAQANHSPVTKTAAVNARTVSAQLRGGSAGRSRVSSAGSRAGSAGRGTQGGRQATVKSAQPISDVKG